MKEKNQHVMVSNFKNEEAHEEFVITIAYFYGDYDEYR